MVGFPHSSWLNLTHTHTQQLYPFTHQQALRLFPRLPHCKEHCWGAGIFLRECFWLHIFAWKTFSVFFFSCCCCSIPRDEITESHNRWKFNYLRNHYRVCQRCIILIFASIAKEFLLREHGVLTITCYRWPFQSAILVGVYRYFIMRLVCIPRVVMVSIFMSLLAIHMF